MRVLSRSGRLVTTLGALFTRASISFRTPLVGRSFGSLVHSSFPASAFAIDESCGIPNRRSLSIMSSNNNDELANAQKAAPAEVTIFDKIVKGDIPCTEVYSDEKVLAFRDVNPAAPVHILVIPKDRDGLSQLSRAREDQKELLGHLMFVAQEIGKKECPNGFRVVVNDGRDGAQSVYHLHLHVLGGRPMTWPPG